MMSWLKRHQFLLKVAVKVKMTGGSYKVAGYLGGESNISTVVVVFIYPPLTKQNVLWVGSTCPAQVYLSWKSLQQKQNVQNILQY